MIIYQPTHVRKLFPIIIKDRLKLTAMRIARKIVKMKIVGNITMKIVMMKIICGIKTVPSMLIVKVRR